jgi:hypothetical protein
MKSCRSTAFKAVHLLVIPTFVTQCRIWVEMPLRRILTPNHVTYFPLHLFSIRILKSTYRQITWHVLLIPRLHLNETIWIRTWIKLNSTFCGTNNCLKRANTCRFTVFLCKGCALLQHPWSLTDFALSIQLRWIYQTRLKISTVISCQNYNLYAFLVHRSENRNNSA